MDEAASPAKPSKTRRTGLFIRGFLPENGPQLLFPLASFILFLGSSYSWLPPAHVFHNVQESSAREGLDLWFDLSTWPALARYYIVMGIVRFAFFASLILWCLPVRNLARKFAAWFFLPGALAVGYFLVLVAIGQSHPASLLERASGTFAESLRVLPSRLFALGIGFYLTLLSFALFAALLWAARRGYVSFPWRFRGASAAPEPPEVAATGRRIFVVLIASLIIKNLLDAAFAWPFRLMGSYISPLFTTPKEFPVWEWGNGLIECTVVAACTLLAFRSDRMESYPERFRRDAIGKVAAILLPFAIVLTPRLLLKMAWEFTFYTRGLDWGFPPSWAELFLPKPLPWVLVVYCIACLEELVLRGFLQKKLGLKFGLKRAIFLTALLWWMLPLYGALDPLSSLGRGVPGVTTLISLVIYVAYSVPLGWLYARTRSIWPVALAHGTLILFHVGFPAYPFYFGHQFLYWFELVAWILAGWFLFKHYPPEQAPLLSGELVIEPSTS